MEGRGESWVVVRYLDGLYLSEPEAFACRKIKFLIGGLDIGLNNEAAVVVALPRKNGCSYQYHCHDYYYYHGYISIIIVFLLIILSLFLFLLLVIVLINVLPVLKILHSEQGNGTEPPLPDSTEAPMSTTAPCSRPLQQSPIQG